MVKGINISYVMMFTLYDSMNGRYPECVSRLKKWLSSRITDVSWTVSYAADVIKVSISCPVILL